MFMPYRRGKGGLNVPEQRAASHCGLYDEHVSVCDMVQYPVDQLAVGRSSVHAELFG